MLINGIQTGIGGGGFLGGGGGEAMDELTALNKGMAALDTVLDGDLACSTGVLGAPDSGWPAVFINGTLTLSGNGSTNAPCYFSADGGLTAKADGAVATGDLLYWNGSIATFQLATTDIIDFVYETTV